MRKCGVLLPVFALPSKYGIGGFSKEAYSLIDKLKMAGIKMWQMLPLGPTGYGDSPYQSFSTNAGNPYMIDLETLIQKGLLEAVECDQVDGGQHEKHINYYKLYLTRFELLRIAYRRFTDQLKNHVSENNDYQSFIHENQYWLEDYCLYMAIKKEQGQKSWNQWPVELKTREESAISQAKIRLADEIGFYTFMQYEFFLQWNAIHEYAKKNEVQLIGDIPFYVAMDSSDVWANPKLFKLTGDCEPIAVAGCPPDGFTPEGQLWGNPIYNWEQQQKDGFCWWVDRILYQLRLYDILRVDHFRGFDEYYAIPYGAETAVNGTWEKGPGIELFHQLKKMRADIPIIAEDLGFLTDSVKKLVADTGFSGMKILQFAFDSREQSDYLPHSYIKNCVVYTGTHDNNTINGWYEQIDDQTKNYIKEYIGINDKQQVTENQNNNEIQMNWEFIRLAMASVSDTCIIPIQDFLGLGTEGRINVPSTLGGNWSLKLTEEQMNQIDLNRIRKMLGLYGRL